MSDWKKVGECVICKAEREVTLYKGRMYCWMDLKLEKDKDNSSYIERGYKKFHRLVSKFKNER